MRAGDTIRGRWRVEGLAGRGASGEVYRGHDLVEGTTVAVKLLVRDELTAKARFEREIAILSALAVPGVVRYVGASDEPPALVMQWLDGETLKERLQRGALGVDATLRLARELASALAATHELGIVHRDLKPSNVFMAQDGESTRAVIIDFGIARRASEATLTQAGDTLGTPAYMAPEQVRGLAVDARADVYALGAVLYECVTGAPLVDARDVMSALAQILDAEPKTLAHVADAPPWLVGLVAAMVSHDAARRPADGRAVLAALDGEPGTAAIAGLSREETSVVSIVRMADALAAQETLSLSARASLPQQLLAIAREHDGQLTRQADGAWVVSFARSGSASDRAARAVACAGAMHSASGLSTAVATGRGLVTASGVLGEVVTRAQALTGSAVAIDVATQALLATRDGTRGEGPFVGRKSQLATLTTMLAEAGDERVTRSVLLVGEAGAGKSRLVRQLLTAWRGPVWSVRAEATRSAVPLALLGELVAAAKQAGNALDPVLEAARAADPMALARQREAAMKRLLHEASARDGLIVCIDDLQWADGSSLQLIAELLTEDAPLMWLLTCRTEAAERVNGELRVGVELRLPPLSLAAASELVSALMPDAEPELVAAITHKGAGHPLFLEELARSARAGLGTTPDTVRMMLQARLEQLHPTARRVLRAAAVFGRDFWLEGVAFVADLALEVVRQHLVALAREDLARPHRDLALPGGGGDVPARPRARGRRGDVDRGRQAARAPLGRGLAHRARAARGDHRAAPGAGRAPDRGRGDVGARGRAGPPRRRPGRRRALRRRGARLRRRGARPHRAGARRGRRGHGRCWCAATSPRRRSPRARASGTRRRAATPGTWPRP
ncbi:MAG: protein kinase [Myxococcota bacterium]